MNLRRFVAACIVAGSALLAGCDEADVLSSLLSDSGYTSSSDSWDSGYSTGYYDDVPQYQNWDLLNVKSGKMKR